MRILLLSLFIKDRVEIINANNPHGNGLLLPEDFVPFPKNPLIAKFFIQLGRVDELGSGVLNVYRFLKYYSPGQQPQFIENKLFKTIIPIGDVIVGNYEMATVITGDAVNNKVRDRLIAELKWIKKHEGVTLGAIMDEFEIKMAAAQRDIKKLKGAGLVAFRGSDRSGKYVLTEKGSELFKTD